MKLICLIATIAARGAKQGIVLPHIFAVFGGVVRGADTKAKI